MDVLLVDDEAEMRSMLRTIIDLRTEGCEVVGEATDGEEAIAKVRELKPEIVLMDHKMPRVNGAEATKTITAEFPHLRVIGYTASTESAQEMRLAGAVDAFTKDDVDALIESLHCD